MAGSSIKLITVCSHPEYANILIYGAQKHGWDLVVIQTEWRGFGTKLLATYEYLKQHSEIERFVFCDAFDVIILGSPQEFDEKLDWQEGVMLSAEKNCWPDSNLANQFSEIDSPFKYVNSGLYYASSKWFINLIEYNKPNYEDDDQLYMTNFYLNAPDVMLDTRQTIFNSHSFIADGEYGYENGRVQVLGNEPIFIHLNGRTIDEKLNALI